MKNFLVSNYKYINSPSAPSEISAVTVVINYICRLSPVKFLCFTFWTTDLITTHTPLSLSLSSAWKMSSSYIFLPLKSSVQASLLEQKFFSVSLRFSIIIWPSLFYVFGTGYFQRPLKNLSAELSALPKFTSELILPKTLENFHTTCIGS